MSGAGFTFRSIIANHPPHVNGAAALKIVHKHLAFVVCDADRFIAL
jgi:hypothetical protein